MAATLADRLLARDDDVLVPLRALGAPWNLVHLAPSAAPTRGRSVREVLDRPPHACSLRPHGVKRLTEALLFATAGPPLGALVTCGVAISCRPGDVGVSLDRELRLDRIDVGYGAVGTVHGTDVDVDAAALLLAPMIGGQLDAAVDELLVSLGALAGDHEMVRNLFRDRLRLLRHAIVRASGGGGVAIDDALQRVGILARRRTLVRTVAFAS